MRLYRAEAVNDGSHRAPLFSVDRALAEAAANGGASRLVYLDVPAERISELRPSREAPKKIFFVPPALSALRKPVGRGGEATVLPFQRRAEAALTTRAPERPIVSKEDQVMRTTETMEAARRNMADAMTRLGDYLPEGARHSRSRRGGDQGARAAGAEPRTDRGRPFRRTGASERRRAVHQREEGNGDPLQSP